MRGNWRAAASMRAGCTQGRAKRTRSSCQGCLVWPVTLCFPACRISSAKLLQSCLASFQGDYYDLVRMHTHTHARTRTHTQTHTHARTHTHTHARTHTRAHTFLSRRGCTVPSGLQSLHSQHAPSMPSSRAPQHCHEFVNLCARGGPGLTTTSPSFFGEQCKLAAWWCVVGVVRKSLPPSMPPGFQQQRSLKEGK